MHCTRESGDELCDPSDGLHCSFDSANFGSFGLFRFSLSDKPAKVLEQGFGNILLDWSQGPGRTASTAEGCVRLPKHGLMPIKRTGLAFTTVSLSLLGWRADEASKLL